jgi:hypothetical protein
MTAINFKTTLKILKLCNKDYSISEITLINPLLFSNNAKLSQNIRKHSEFY